MNYDALYNPYPSRRSTVYAKNGMVATSQSLAAQAGLAWRWNETLEKEAIRWATGRGNRNGRCAQQFARHWVGLALLDGVPSLR